MHILFALLVGFIAVEVWSNFDKAKVAVATEASAPRAVVLLAGNFREEQRTRIYALINRHIEEAVNKEWPAMARGDDLMIKLSGYGAGQIGKRIKPKERNRSGGAVKNSPPAKSIRSLQYD